MYIPLIKIRHHLERWYALLLGISLLLGSGGIALAVIAPDVENTRHNLSASNATVAIAGSSFGATVKATSETQICVFCHTPHAATSGGTVVAPLWNRALTTQTYAGKFYDSASLDATPKPGEVSPGNPAGGAGIGSKLCLSCHDGTLAIGTVGVLNNAPGNIAMQGTNPVSGGMPDGTMGANTGFTRKIGIDLTNDHPISFTYDAAQAARDGELYVPGAPGVAVANRVRGQPRPQFPLIGGQLECITCHDPHLKSDQVDPVTFEPINNKFLRGNRFQLTSPTPNVSGVSPPYDPTKDIICLACHNKPTWVTSTHANALATSEKYKSVSSDLRDFPRDISVWQAACTNCHDMHTVPGARRLLREGTDAASTLTNPKVGGNSAIEEVCYQCHSPGADRILVQELPDQVPDIKTPFSYMTHMPIVTAEQGKVPPGGGPTGNTVEMHNIGQLETPPDGGALDLFRGRDFIEPRSLMGNGNLANRHAECTDCHQPHRLTRTVLFNGDPTIPSASGTHRHAGSNDIGGVPHNNLASGSQRGQFGVEPKWNLGKDRFYDEPDYFVEKRGAVDTAGGSVTAVPTAETTIGVYDVANTYLTREYQVCAKCHSNYAFGNLVGSIANPSNIPSLGRTGGTVSGTNGLNFYTNVFREIQAPNGHTGEGTSATPSGAFQGVPPYTIATPAVDFKTNNHRSWHPVLGPTGRTPAIRGNLTATNWVPPWDADIGVQTMYCTDCHGSSTLPGVSSQPVDGPAEGPHGSENIFLLKGWWDNCTGKATTTTAPNTYNGNGCLNDSTPSIVGNITLNPAVIRPADSVGTTDTSNDLCFKCHSFPVYGQGLQTGVKSGFSGTLHTTNGHGHQGLNVTARCMMCHVAVPHGWKNKNFLVNLNDVGPEATCRQEDADDAPVGYKCTETVGLGNPMAPGTQVRNLIRIPNPNGYSNPPYYRGAMLKIRNFAISGNWQKANCGSAGAPGTGYVGIAWMDSQEGCLGLP